MQIKLKGISKRGKDRINEHGDIFEVFEREANEGGQLHAVLVESLNKTWRGEKWLGWFIVEKDVKVIEVS